MDWFHQVDTTYRADLRELNELNFARFDAKLEQRIAEVRADLRSGLAEQRAELGRWMFMFWIGTVIPLGGLIVGLAVAFQ